MEDIMKIELSLKDAIVFALIIVLALTCLVRFAKIEATLQTAALVKVMNDQGVVIQQIVSYLNGKTPAANAPAKIPAQAQAPEIKEGPKNK
jgi:hypothetical protein